MSSHYVAWRGQVYRFDADTEKEARAKAFRWLAGRGYVGSAVHALPRYRDVEAHGGVA